MPTTEALEERLDVLEAQLERAKGRGPAGPQHRILVPVAFLMALGVYAWLHARDAHLGDLLAGLLRAVVPGSGSGTASLEALAERLAQGYGPSFGAVLAACYLVVRHARRIVVAAGGLLKLVGALVFLVRLGPAAVIGIAVTADNFLTLIQVALQEGGVSASGSRGRFTSWLEEVEPSCHAFDLPGNCDRMVEQMVRCSGVPSRHAT